MKLVFVSNFFNHHQAPLSERLYELTRGSYRFVATTPVPQERKLLGYTEDTAPYVFYCTTSDERQAEVQKLIDEAEAVIFGSAPEELLKNRIRDKKLILRYSERPLKNGFQWWKYPLRWFRWHKRNPYGVPIYMLCASAYTAADYAKFGLFRNKALKWGYFPRCKKYEDVEQMLSQKDTAQILWCGRFLDWKHPDAALAVAKRLKADNCRFHLTMIGTGEMEQELKTITATSDLADCVTFTGPMSPELVRTAMEKTGIFLMTSDRKEGWGAVLNEAMNSGCAIVACREAGSVPYLLQDEKNGLIANNVDDRVLYEKIKFLLNHPREQRNLGRMACNSILQEWNPEKAAERLLSIIDGILHDQDISTMFWDGPCSSA